MTGYVYMISDKPRGVIYTGVTSDLHDRIWEHRNEARPGFTSKYSAKNLVWFEMHPNIVLAIQREKSLKRYRREWKVNLIEGLNPTCWTSSSGSTRSRMSSSHTRTRGWRVTMSEILADPRDKPEDDGAHGATGIEFRRETTLNYTESDTNA
jgi:putative endonuclease